MAKSGCGALCIISYVLIMVGSINWGLIGLSYFLKYDLNVVHMLLGTWPSVEYILYLLIGIAAILAIIWHKKCESCKIG